MKSCDEMRAALVDLVFGEMDDCAEAELNEHLLTCSECRLEEARLLDLKDQVRGTEPEPGIELKERIERALPARKTRAWGGALMRPIPAYLALAAAVSGALAVLALPTRRESPSPPVAETRRAAGLAFEVGPTGFTIAASSETGVRSTVPARSGPDSSTARPHLPQDSL